MALVCVCVCVSQRSWRLADPTLMLPPPMKASGLSACVWTEADRGGLWVSDPSSARSRLVKARTVQPEHKAVFWLTVTRPVHLSQLTQVLIAEAVMLEWLVLWWFACVFVCLMQNKHITICELRCNLVPRLVSAVVWWKQALH